HQLIEYAQQGLNVARVKGGDPMVFARGGEELESLHNSGVEVEVVSGITSGIGVPAALGIPLTHRDYSHQILMVTGHAFGGSNDPTLPELHRFTGTIVVYMGFSKATEISASLRHHGLASTTPFAAIQCGTTKDQQFLFGGLSDLSSELLSKSLSSPVLIVI